MIRIILIICSILCLTSCARFDKEKMTFYGYGSYKDADVEMTSKHLFSDLVNIQAIKQ